MRKLLLLLSVTALIGCREKAPEPPSVFEAMPGLPLPPNSEVLYRSGSADALLIRFHSTRGPDEVATYYRYVLSKEPWRLVSDMRTQDGTLALYAERDGPPLWVTIRKSEGSGGSQVELSGAVTKDSAKARRDSVKG